MSLTGNTIDLQDLIIKANHHTKSKKVTKKVDNNVRVYIDASGEYNILTISNKGTAVVGYNMNNADNYIKARNRINDILSSNEPIDLTRINNDINGNPRYVCHFLHFVNNEESDRLNQQHSMGAISEKYAFAINKARKIGGRKFHNKQYGGGIVFQSYNIYDLKKLIRESRNNII